MGSYTNPHSHLHRSCKPRPVEAEITCNDILHHILKSLDVLASFNERNDAVIGGDHCSLRAELAGQTAQVVSQTIGLGTRRNVGPDRRHRA
jgi:hypothetical protein